MSQLLCTAKATRTPGKVVVATNVVSMDEPCFGLSEVNLMSPGSRGVHRYQVLAVLRQGKLVSFMRDMGPISEFAGIQQFRVPGGIMDEATERYEILHTVGELYDIADYLRNGYSKPPDFTPGDLYRDLRLQKEEKARCYKRASTFASSVKIQRS